MSSSACVYFNTFYNAQKNFRQAEKERRKQEKKERGQAKVQGQRRVLQKANNLYDQAARKAAKVLEKFPESDLVDDAMFLMGRSFYWQGDYKNAIETLTDLETSFPDSPFFDQARYWRALSYIGQNEVERAGQVLRSLFNEAELELAVLAGQQLGELAVDSEDYAAAIQEFEATLEAFPKSDLEAELLLQLGEAVFALEDSARYGEVLQVLERVLKAGPSTEIEYRAQLNRGRVLYAQENISAALKTYKRLLGEGRFRFFEGETRLLIGQSYQDQGQLEEAQNQYEKVRDDFPQSAVSAMALFRTGELFLKKYGDAELAEEYFKETRTEKAGSKGARLGQEALRYMGELDRILLRIHEADSLAALRKEKVGEVDKVELSAAAVDSSIAAVDSMATANDSSVAVVDSLDGETGAEWFFKEEEKKREKQRQELVESGEILDDLFSVAEIYRSNLGVADSAQHYYAEIIRRFPQSTQLPRALYGIAWIEEELKNDTAAAREHWQHLIDTYPASEQANAGRRRLGQEVHVTDEEKAAAEFVRIEALRLEDSQTIERYVPLLDSLSRAYPTTRTAAQAAYTAAWAYQNIAADSAEAEKRFDRLIRSYPESEFAAKINVAREAQNSGALAKLERSLRAMIAGSKPGERIELIAVEPDTLDTLLLAHKYYRFGLKAHGHGELTTARQNYQQSLEQRKGDAEVHYLLGNVLWEEGYADDAIEEYRMALEITPGHLKTFYRIFDAYTVGDEIDSANAYLRKIVRRDRRNRQVSFILEEYPDLHRASGELLDQDELEALALLPPEEDYTLSPKGLQLAEVPVVKEMVVPKYPAAAQGDSAVVLLDILVNKSGRPASVEVFKGEPPFVEAAVAAAEKYQFFPAVGRQDERVKVWVALELPVGPRSGGEGAAATDGFFVGESAEKEAVKMSGGGSETDPAEEPSIEAVIDEAALQTGGEVEVASREENGTSEEKEVAESPQSE